MFSKCESGRGWINAGSSVPSTFSVDGMALPLHSGGVFLKVMVRPSAHFPLAFPGVFPWYLAEKSSFSVLVEKPKQAQVRINNSHIVYLCIYFS